MEKRKNDLLRAISVAQSQFISQVNVNEIFSSMLDNLLVLTDSEYGFIGEIKFQNDQTPFLKTFALTNIAWNDDTKKFYEENAPNGLEFFNLQTLFGQVMVTRGIVIANDPKNDPRAGGIPDGHPDLNHFLGIPLFLEKKFLGMVGIANRPGGYDQSIVDFLKPFLTTCAQLINGIQVNREKERIANELELQKISAENANNAKTEFLARMNHELRTPLNAIIGIMELLEDEVKEKIEISGSEIEEYLGDIRYASNHLLNLISDTLNLTDIEQGLDKSQYESILINELIDQVGAQCQGLKKTNSFEVIRRQTCERIHTDPTKLQIILFNLLGNAFKFTQNGKVRLEVSDVTDDKGVSLELRVEDNGIGMSEDFLQDAFEAFSQEQSDNTRDFEGAGLGLTIVKRLVNAFGGDIQVSSKKDVGSIFTVTLPIKGA